MKNEIVTQMKNVFDYYDELDNPYVILGIDDTDLIIRIPYLYGTAKNIINLIKKDCD